MWVPAWLWFRQNLEEKFGRQNVAAAAWKLTPDELAAVPGPGEGRA
jgi:hypothetical protein